MRYVQIFALLLFGQSASLSKFQLEKLNDDYTIKVLEQFADYIVHVHFDNTTIEDVNNFINSKRKSTIALLQNYDLDGYFERDDGNKYLHVILMEKPKKFERYSNVTFNLECTDVVMFFVRNETEIDDEYWLIDGLDKGGCVLLYDVNRKNFSYVQFYCGELHGILQEVVYNTSTPNLRQYVNNFKDFNGHEFIVGFINNEPFAWCSNEDVYNEDFCVLTGVEGELLKNLREWFNFEVLLDFHNEVHEDYAQIVQKIHRTEIHWGIGGITLTLRRYFDADFGAPLKIESYVVLISIPKDQGIQGGYIFIPFKFTVWLCLLGNFLVLSFLLKLSYKVQRRMDNYNRNFEHLLVPIKAFLNESEGNINANTWSLKILYGCSWFVLGIIFCNLYTSKLMSVLIKPHFWQPQSVQELLDNKYTFQMMPKEWDVLKESTNTTLDTVYKQVLSLSKDDLDYCEGIRQTLKESIGFIQEEIPLQFQILNICEDELTFEEYESLRIVNERIFPNNHAWPMQLAAPYVNRFSSFFLQLQAIGYLENLYKKYETKKRILRTNEAVTGLKAIIKFEHLIDSAYILLLGYVLAIVIFLVELVVGRRK